MPTSFAPHIWLRDDETGEQVEYMTAAEAAAQLGLSHAHVNRLAKRYRERIAAERAAGKTPDRTQRDNELTSVAPGGTGVYAPLVWIRVSTLSDYPVNTDPGADERPSWRGRGWRAGRPRPERQRPQSSSDESTDETTTEQR